MEKFVDGYPVFLLMLIRMVGFVFYSSILGRKNLPATVKLGLAGALAWSAFASSNLSEFNIGKDLLTFILKLGLEFFFGFALSFVVELLLSSVIFGGELFDMQMGLSMNKFYDSTSGTELPTTGALIRAMFMITFFLTNSHHNLLRIVHSSYKAIPVGKVSLEPAACLFIVGLMKDVFELGIKLAMPMFAAVLIMDVGVGILMRTIPQLNVFILNIYVKFIIGFLLLLKISPDLAEFCGRLTDLIFVNIESLGKLVAGYG